jgi:Amt family ammonium transporter
VAEGASLAKQALGLVAVAAWSAAGTALILLICRFTTGLRVDREQEMEGLDSALHGESIH